MELHETSYKLKSPSLVGRNALMAGIIGSLLSIVGFFLNSPQFFHAYLVAYTFWLTLVLGALFFVMLQHLVGAVWSIVLRRIAESIMSAVPLMAALFIPVLIGMHDLYHWSHADAVAVDHVLKAKSAYLNTTFFIIRSVVYFAVWFLLSRALYRASVQQDSRFDHIRLAKMKRISAAGMILFALTTTFAAFDWLMSLDPHWYSTIFGVYVFSGGLLSSIVAITLICVFMRRRGVLSKEITHEHYHDLGKLTFAFMVFWAYVAFSQYLLIWYANIPEETIWYHARWIGSWKAISLLLVFGHFVVPFFIMITRPAKRNLAMMTTMALWLLFMHWVDHYWLVMPTLHQEGAALSWIDVATMLAISGLCVWFIWRRLSANAIVPVSDPRLAESMEFTNV
jgi:hypothetical protein